MRLIHPKSDNKFSHLAFASDDLSPGDLRTIASALAIMANYAYTKDRIPSRYQDDIRDLVDEVLPFFEEAQLPVRQFLATYDELLEEGVIDSTKRQFETFLDAVDIWRKQLATIPSMSPVFLEMLADAKNAAKGSNSAYKELYKKAGILKNPVVTRIFQEPQVQDTQKELLPQIEELVKYFGGTGYDLDRNQRAEARSTDMESFQEFLILRREATAKSKEFIRNWVRSNGSIEEGIKGLGNYEDLLNDLDRANIKVHNLPTGFEGYIDDQARLYTLGGKLVNGVPSGGTVTMNPKYDPEQDNAYIFKSDVPGALTTSLYYTVDYRAQANKQKFQKVESLADALYSVRLKWRRIIKSGGKDPHDDKFLAACILETIYQTQGRIGGRLNATSVSGLPKKTFGISTLQMQHVIPKGNGVDLRYKGKKVSRQWHRLRPSNHILVKKMIRMMLEWKEERKDDDPLWMTRDGDPFPALKVNKLLRRLGAPDGVTVHKFRTLRGTEALAKIVETHPFKDGQTHDTKKVTQWLRSEATKIGEQLGHTSGEKVTGDTAIQAYVEPTIMLGVYNDAQAVPPKSMLKLVGIDPNDLEGFTG